MTIINILCIVLGAFYLIAGALKVLGHPHMVEEFDSLSIPQSLRTITGLIEIVAGPMMILVFWYPTVAGIGALIMAPVMLGAAYINFTRRNAWFGLGVLVLFGLCVFATRSLLLQYLA